MSKKSTNTIWERTRKAREDAGFKEAKHIPEEFKKFGFSVTTDAYYKYETRSALRQDLITPFCTITGINEHWLLSGKGPMKTGPHDEGLFHLLEKVAKLHEEHRKHIEFMIDSYLQKQTHHPPPQEDE